MSHNLLKKWWVVRDLNPRHLRCKRRAQSPNSMKHANGALHRIAMFTVWPRYSGSVRFGEPERTSQLVSLATTSALCALGLWRTTA